MTAITRYKLRKLLKYALLTVGVAWVLTLFSGEALGLHFLGWLLLGLWTGVLEEFLFGRHFRSLVIPLQFLGKVLLVNLLTFLLMLGAMLIGSEQLLPGIPTGEQTFVTLFAHVSFVKLMLRVVVVTSVAILIVQVEEAMGRRMFLGFLLGRYERPKHEQRILLTVDLMGSTGLAEQLGDLRYFRLLNNTYSLMTDAVLRNEADIHKYIGDEVIFTWPMRVGLRDANCLDLYFDICERLEEHAHEMREDFGVVPRFRAALHGGRVLSVQLGHIKRAIDFSGDVMNSLSRMLGLSKELDAGLLVSAEILARMPDAEKRFEIGPERMLPVRGRKRAVRVHEVRRLRKA